MDPKDVFAKAVASTTPFVQRVAPEDMTNATPCSEWDLRALLNHLVYEVLWVPDLLAGKTVAEVGAKYDGDVLRDNPIHAWEKASATALEAVKKVDPEQTVHLSYADKPAAYYIMEIANDVLIHGWDVGRSLRCSVVFDPELAQAMYDSVLPKRTQFATSNMFGPIVPVPDDVPIQVKLLALEGRHADVEP